MTTRRPKRTRLRSAEVSDREHGEMVAYEGANLYPTEFKDTYPTRR